MRYNIATGVRHAKTKLQKMIIGLAALAFPVSIALSSGGAMAATTYTLTPWTYDPGNLCTGIMSAWDNSVGNPPPSLHLTKPCLTAVNASSGATINGVSGIHLTELNFDYQNGGHCGAGAPRFNVSATDGFHFMGGCANGTQTDLGNGWTHVVIDPTNPAQAFPVLTPGATINSIDIVFDEGTDVVGQGTPGSVFIDNISINNQVIGGPNTPASKDACKNGGWMTAQDASGKSFKNQGDCVSYVATGGKNAANGH
jgi:hypothetical protein